MFITQKRDVDRIGLMPAIRGAIDSIDLIISQLALAKGLNLVFTKDGLHDLASTNGKYTQQCVGKLELGQQLALIKLIDSYSM
jgi:hypothetical protein